MLQIVREKPTVCRVRLGTSTSHGKRLLYETLFQRTHNWYQYTRWLRHKPSVGLRTDNGCTFTHRGKNHGGWFTLRALTKNPVNWDLTRLRGTFH
jgi:hypothetical protein